MILMFAVIYLLRDSVYYDVFLNDLLILMDIKRNLNEEYSLYILCRQVHRK